MKWFINIGILILGLAGGFGISSLYFVPENSKLREKISVLEREKNDYIRSANQALAERNAAQLEQQRIEQEARQKLQEASQKIEQSSRQAALQLSKIKNNGKSEAEKQSMSLAIINSRLIELRNSQDRVHTSTGTAGDHN